METEEEDIVLLNALGVTSANPEDIERHLLEKAQRDVQNNNTFEVGRDEKTLVEPKKDETLSANIKKLRAVEFEIDAVTSAVAHFENHENNLGHYSDDKEEKKQGNVKDNEVLPQNSLTLQHSLASDRLKSLMKTRAQLQKDVSISSADSKHAELIRDIVKEDPKANKALKVVKRSKNKKKQFKTVPFSEDDDFETILTTATAGFVETERDRSIRKGLLTPFHELKGYERRIQEPGPSNRPIFQRNVVENIDLASSSIDRAVLSMSEASKARPSSKFLDPKFLPRLDAPTQPFQRLRKPFKIPQSLEIGTKKSTSKRKKKRPQPGKKMRKTVSNHKKFPQDVGMPDVKVSSNDETEFDEDYDDEEENPFATLEGGLKIPEIIYMKLFEYQKVGVQWLWELHCQRAGGIIGDEMGLGKTVQVLAFLGSLHFSNMYKPSIIICPVTLLQQWRREARKWYSGFHVEVLHDSAQEISGIKKPPKSDDSSEELADSDMEKKTPSKNTKKWDSLINRVLRSESGLLITTYEQLRLLGGKLLDIEWGYAVLDEGHRIRNPNAEVTLVCKQLQTVHRIIMTGAPIQNKLSELWSLFDFVFPGKLGVLPVFEAEFSVPISVGGYANATPLQVSTAYRCAVVLRDLIMPYLLRRMKADVDAQLPKKTEHVLFCSLTSEQRSVYRAFLASSEVEQIFEGSRNSLSGIDVMRKICNHPDLLEREHSHANPDYGNPERSGKVKVVGQVLKLWKERGHRVLLFAQTQQMLDILENLLIANDYNYRRMDGHTPVKQRMTVIDEFNNSNDVFIFILTTKVGGLGTNLTGADRVIIFDPDWNPSTDMQARERAWRIGQTKDVTVYRLITRGTIEEKVYHRQIYKHFLTNKILQNPQQKRFFKSRDMKDLFTLNDDGEHDSTETSNIFGQLVEEVTVIGSENKRKDKSKQLELTSDPDGFGMNTRPHLGSREMDEKKANHSGKKIDEETSFLTSLFAAHGIHSAINHDAIMNVHDEERTKLEEQAIQVARRAAEALHQSRMMRSLDRITVPTWTGKSGTAGAPSSVRGKFGSTISSQLVGTSNPSEETQNNRINVIAAGSLSGKALSSAELLAKIKENRERAITDGMEHQLRLVSSTMQIEQSSSNKTSRSSNNSRIQPEILIRQICTFIQKKGGKIDSPSIVSHFKDRIPSNDLPLFKNLLKEIATLEKNPNGSNWVLKPEYQDQ